jgi:ethanolamine ammonia-lyase small subunit
VSGNALATDPWQVLRRFTSARIGLGRTGHALVCRAVLDFQLAHAQARDAVHRPLDCGAVERTLGSASLCVEHIASQAGNRAEYLQRPDLGRRLDEASRQRVAALATPAVGPRAPRRATNSTSPSPSPGASGATPMSPDSGEPRPQVESPDVIFVVGDGLSTSGVEKSAGSLVVLAARALRVAGLRVFPTVFLATQARVALADEVGELLHARTTVMVIGERPGLSSPDSVGLYLTYAPRTGRQNAERNCISNVHADGLVPSLAAPRLVALLREALRLGASGVSLKEPPEVASLLPRPAPQTRAQLEARPAFDPRQGGR